MSTALEDLIGNSITKASSIHDYFQIFFENGSILNIYNPFLFQPTVKFSELIGRKIIEVKISQSHFLFSISGDITLSIDRNFEGYINPEILELSRPGKPLVVWQNEAI
jgi:hypothetical protein